MVGYKCAINICENYKQETKSKKVKYFPFPSNKSFLKQWLYVCDINKNKVGKHYRVCSNHFVDGDYLLKDILLNIPLTKRKLKKSAVPSVNVLYKNQSYENAIRFTEQKRKKLINSELVMSEDSNSLLTSEYKSTLKIEIIEFNDNKFYTTESTIDESVQALEQNEFNRDHAKVEQSYEIEVKEEEPISYEENNETEEKDYGKLINETPHRICGKIILFEQMMESLDAGLLFECTFCHKHFEKFYEFMRHLNEYHLNEHHLKENVNSNNSNIHVIIDKNIETPEIDTTAITEQFTNIEFKSEFEEDEFEIPGSKMHSSQKMLKMVKSKASKPYSKKSANSDDTGKTCEICNKRFSSQHFFKRHEASCKIIKQYEAKLQEFNTIDNDENGRHPLKCRYCETRFISRIKCVEHECSHNGIKLFKCKYCEKEFVYKDYFEKHLNIHKGIKPNKCHFCDKAFNRREHLKCHLKRHLNERSFKCSYCDKCFIEMSEKNIHERRHIGDRPYLCNECGKSFFMKSELSNHFESMHSNTSEAFLCSKCGKSFKTKLYLSFHNTAMHKIKKNKIKCTKCDELFLTKYDVSVHKKSVHNREVKKIDNRYQCIDCKKTYKYYKSLWLHKKNHSNEKYTCPMCSKVYNQMSSWYSHKRKCVKTYNKQHLAISSDN